MATIDEITKTANRALNQAFAHYFINLTAGQNKIHEINFITELIKMMQPWLFFTEKAMDNVQAYIYRDALGINLVYSLTALFRQRFTLSVEDYQEYIKHLAVSFNTQENDDEILSLMAPEYRARLTNPSAIEMLLFNNRPLVMLVSMMLYFDTSLFIPDGSKK